MDTNILLQPSVSLAELFHLLGQPVRIQILLIIAPREACVCHIEAVLGIRQAAISQHLMVLRDAGLVSITREGRFIFYRLENPELASAIFRLADVAGISRDELESLASRPVCGCTCPQCNPDLDPELTCQ